MSVCVSFSFSFLLKIQDVKREGNAENEISLLCANVGTLNLNESVGDHGVFSTALPVSSTPIKAASGPHIDGNVHSQAQPLSSIGHGFGTALGAFNSIVFGAQALLNGPSNLFVFGNNSHFGQFSSNSQLPIGFSASASAVTFNSFIPGGTSVMDANISTGILPNANHFSGINTDEVANGIQNDFMTANNDNLGNATNSSGVKLEDADNALGATAAPVKEEN